MNQEKQSEVDRLLEQALSQPSDSRRTFLERSTSDTEVIREVISLAASHDAAGAFLEGDARWLEHSVSVEPASESDSREQLTLNKGELIDENGQIHA